MVTGGSDRFVKVWDLKKRVLVRSFEVRLGGRATHTRARSRAQVVIL